MQGLPWFLVDRRRTPLPARPLVYGAYAQRPTTRLHLPAHAHLPFFLPSAPRPPSRTAVGRACSTADGPACSEAKTIARAVVRASHAQDGERLSRQTSDDALMSASLQPTSGHRLRQPPLVREPLASFGLPFRAQAMVAFSACNCLSRLATASLSISAMDRPVIRSRSTGLRYPGIS